MTRAVEDTSALARRQPLPEAEQAELNAQLAADPAEHFWHSAGVAFDEEETAQGEDSAAVARVLQRLEQAATRKVVPLRRRAPVWLLAAAAVLIVGAATAAVVSVRRAREPVRLAPVATPSAVPHVAAVPQLDAPEPSVPAPSAEEAPSASAAVLAPSAPMTAPRSAAELLSDAGRARREGHPARAVEALQALQSRFPSSSQAIAADISLGSLQLQSGAAASALQHYDRYLKRAPGGSLASEAIWGRAQALSRLGRTAEARASFTELVQRYPASPYASSAQAKLRALSGAP